MAHRPSVHGGRDRTELGGSRLSPRVTRGTYKLGDGYIIDTWLPLANRENDYLVDREMQRKVNYTGIWGINEQDRSIQEAMGPIVDRSREHLGTTDIAGIAARRILIRLARRLQQGIEPLAPSHPEVFRHRSFSTVSSEPTFGGILKEFEEHVTSPQRI